MKNLNKVIVLLMTVMVVATMSVMTVSADKWIKTDTGTKYQYTDGSYAKSKWITVKGKKYYIKSNGIRATGLINITSSGTKNLYCFDDNGVMLTGWVQRGKNVYYFQSSGKAVQNKKVKIGNYSYKFDEKGCWTGKVYSVNGKKDVTSTVDVKKLTGLDIDVTTGTSATKSSETKSSETKATVVKDEDIPEYVTIKGTKYYIPQYKNQETFTVGGRTYDFLGGHPVNINGNENTKYVVNVAGCTNEDLECLKYFKYVKYLDLIAEPTNDIKDFNSSITNLDFLQYMPNLITLSVDNFYNLTNIDGISNCKKLQVLQIMSAPITNIDALEDITTLKEVYFILCIHF